MTHDEYVSFLVIQEPYPNPAMKPDWKVKLQTKMYAMASYLSKKPFYGHIWTSDGPPTFELIDCGGTVLKDSETFGMHFRCTGQVTSEDAWFLLAAFLKLTSIPAYHDVIVIAWDDCGDFISYIMATDSEEYFIKRGNVWPVPNGKTMRKTLAQASMITSFATPSLHPRLETRLKPFTDPNHNMRGVFYGSVRIWATTTFQTAALLHQYPLLITSIINSFLQEGKRIHPFDEPWFKIICPLAKAIDFPERIPEKSADKTRDDNNNIIDLDTVILYPVQIPIVLVKKLLYEKNRTMPKEFLTRFWALEPEFIAHLSENEGLTLSRFDPARNNASLLDARILGTKISYGVHNWLLNLDENANWLTWSCREIPLPLMFDPMPILDQHDLKMIERLEGGLESDIVNFTARYLAVRYKFLISPPRESQNDAKAKVCVSCPSKSINETVKKNIIETLLSYKCSLVLEPVPSEKIFDLCDMSQPISGEQTADYLDIVSGGNPDDLQGLLGSDEKVDLDLEELLINQTGEAALGAEFNNEFSRLKQELEKVGLGDLASDLRRKVIDQEDDDSSEEDDIESDGDSMDDKEMDREFNQVKRVIDPHTLFGLANEDGGFLTKANQLESINGIGPTKVMLR